MDKLLSLWDLLSLTTQVALSERDLKRVVLHLKEFCIAYGRRRGNMIMYQMSTIKSLCFRGQV